MKKIFLVAAFLVSGFLAKAVEETSVNSKLPEDRIIHPKGDAEETVAIAAEFVSEREILSVAQGNWRKVIKLITYRVAEGTEGFPEGRLTFICEDAYPVEGSRIKAKRFPWPFKPGKMEFQLKRDGRALLSPFFEIVSYRAMD